MLKPERHHSSSEGYFIFRVSLWTSYIFSKLLQLNLVFLCNYVLIIRVSPKINRHDWQVIYHQKTPRITIAGTFIPVHRFDTQRMFCYEYSLVMNHLSRDCHWFKIL